MYKHIAVIVCAFLLALVSPTTWSGANVSELPRTLGPFKLGMNPAQFAQATGQQPQGCPVCIDHEVYANLTAEQVRRVLPTLNTNAGMDFFFFENQLYHISLGTEATDLAAVRKDFAARYGAAKTFELKNGTSYLKWEDSGTVVTANYQTANEQVFALNYFDWNLKEDRDYRASVSIGQAER